MASGILMALPRPSLPLPTTVDRLKISQDGATFSLITRRRVAISGLAFSFADAGRRGLASLAAWPISVTYAPGVWVPVVKTNIPRPSSVLYTVASYVTFDAIAYVATTSASPLNTGLLLAHTLAGPLTATRSSPVAIGGGVRLSAVKVGPPVPLQR